MRLVLLPTLLLACDAGKLTIEGELGDPDSNTGQADTSTPEDDTGEPSGNDNDGDGYGAAEDCDDDNASVYPGAEETCDGVDEDCDGVVDEDAIDASTFFIDEDTDGYGSEEIWACEMPEGAVTEGGDCADEDPRTHPGAEEVCGDTVDNDCDGGPGDCQLTGIIGLVDVTAVIYGEAAEDRMGMHASNLGDTTGDGRDDLLIGIPASDDSTTDAGIAVVMAGPHSGESSVSGATLRLLGERVGDAAGVSVASAGHINSDILADLIVGAPGAEGVGVDAGRAYLVLGGSSGEMNLSDAQAIYLGEFEGDGAGHSLTRVGDMDGDGESEIAIAAPWAANPAPESGAIYFVSPAATGTHSLATASGRLVGTSSGEQAGRAMAPAGDLNGDGHADLLVGAPYHHGGSTGEESGRVYVVTDGPSEGPLHDHSILINGEGDNAYVGTDMVAPGDIDGDGSPDLVVGSGNADGGGTDSGEIYVLLGPITEDRSILEADIVIRGESTFDYAGRALGAAGDFNRDGLADLLIGAPGDDYGANNAGAAYLLYGPAADHTDLSTAPGKLYGADNDHLAGSHIGHAGDMNGDGWDDFYVGAPYIDHPEINAGGIYVISGTSGM